ncbi:GTPase Era, putative [Hepatocystis sp. ex Piliocolobus tephrosceles]|nr:GTPase Era, putative [Hepatocystis sp. ex Piliocolobus tephrosceles]
MLKNNTVLWTLLKKKKCGVWGDLNLRNFSIMERYTKARPHCNEFKMNEMNTNEDKKEENSNKKKKSIYYGPNITRGLIPKSAYMNTWKIPEQPAEPHFLKIALVGAPNAGKSSLLNSILNKTIAAVSPKINTTKEDIKGIYTKDNVQLIFIDCPGIIPSHKKKKFCKELVNYAWKGYEEADLVLFVTDTVKRPTSDIINIVRLLAPKKVEAYDSESDEEINVDCERNPNSIHEGNENDEEGGIFSRKLQNGYNGYNGDNHEGNPQENYKKRHKDLQHKEHNVLNQKESEFIEFFSSTMENDSIYDKSVKEDIFKNRKKIIESYFTLYDFKNNKTKGIKKEVIPPVILVLNKVDLCTENKWAKARAKEYIHNGDFDNIFFISAKYKKGIDEMLNYIIKYKTKEKYWIYPPNESTTLTKVKIVEQLINTYLYCWFNKDVPYKIKHHILSWHVDINNSLIIEYQLLVKNEKVAKIICGVHNKLIINMRKNVSYKLTQLWGQNVYVHIHVKAVDT